MNKQAFNKENPVDLFSQLVKVLSKKDDNKEMSSLINRLKNLSSEIFSKLNESYKMSNIEKIAEEIVVKAKKTKFYLGPGVEGLIEATRDGQGFEIKISGSFRSGNDINKTIKDIQKAWKEIDID